MHTNAILLRILGIEDITSILIVHSLLFLYTWLLHKMRQKKIPSYLIHWINSFMSQRRCRVQVGDAEVAVLPRVRASSRIPSVPNAIFDIY